MHVVALIVFFFVFVEQWSSDSPNYIRVGFNAAFLIVPLLSVYRYHAQSILRRERDETEQYVQSKLQRALLAVIALQLLVFYKVMLILLNEPFLPPRHYWSRDILHKCQTEMDSSYIERFCDTNLFQLTSARSPRQFGQPTLECTDELHPPFRSLFDGCYTWHVRRQVFLRVASGAVASFNAITALTAFGLLEGVAEGISLHNWWRHPVRGVALTSHAHVPPPSTCGLMVPMCALPCAHVHTVMGNSLRFCWNLRAGDREHSILPLRPVYRCARRVHARHWCQGT